MTLTPVKKKGAANVFDKMVKDKERHDAGLAEMGLMDEIFGEGSSTSTVDNSCDDCDEDVVKAAAELQAAKKQLGEDNKVRMAADYIEARPTLPLKAKIDFKDVLDRLTTLDDKYKVLWKQIYDHAMADRNNAYVIWYDLYQMVIGDEEKHFKHGAILAKYMERFEKANTQLLKLAELLDKVREKEEEENGGPTGSNLYDEWERQK